MIYNTYMKSSVQDLETILVTEPLFASNITIRNIFKLTENKGYKNYSRGSHFTIESSVLPVVAELIAEVFLYSSSITMLHNGLNLGESKHIGL